MAVASGRTNIGGFDYNGQSFAFINFLKLSNQIDGPASFPALLDVNGFPTVSPTGTDITLRFVLPLSSTYGAGGSDTYRIVGTGTFGPTRIILPAGTFTVTGDVGSRVTANSGVNLTFAGVNPDVTVKLNSLPDTGNGNTLTLSFLAGSATAFVSPQLSFHRTDHQSLVNLGETFNPDFLALMTELNPNVIRPMDWLSINRSIWAQHSYRAPAAALSYRAARWHSPAWAGTVGNSGSTYSCSAPANWGGLVDGATVQGIFTNASPATIAVSGSADNGSGLVRLTIASTTGLIDGQIIAFSSNSGTGGNGGVWPIDVIDGTHIDLLGSAYIASNDTSGSISTQTLNVGSSGAKLISGSSGNASVLAGEHATATYDTVRSSWIYLPRGLGDGDSYGALPVEVLVTLCNKLQKNLWYNISLYYTDASVLACATYIKDNLASGLVCYYGLSNETWNPGFTQTDHVKVRAGRLGFTSATTRYYSYMGLRCRQIFGIVKTLYGASSIANKCVFEFQAFSTDTAAFKSYAMEGSLLVTGNADYNAFTGSTSYNVAPNRPIDYIDTLSYATYFAGGVLNNGLYLATGTYSGMTAAATNYASGVPAQMASALAWLDADVRTGISTISAATNTVQTLQALSVTVYPRWETVAQSYDASRLGAGKLPLAIAHYEGGFEAIAPTTDDCTTIGISSTYGNVVNGSGTITTRGTVQLMLDAYKEHGLFQSAVINQGTQFMNTALVGGETANHSVVPGWFVLQGIYTHRDGRWSMMTGSTYSTRYKSFDAHQLLNNSQRRFRITT